MLIFESNLTYITMAAFNHSKVLFSFKELDKCGHYLMIGSFFSLVLYVFAGLYYLKVHYKKRVKYFIEECFLKFPSVQFYWLLNIRGFVRDRSGSVLLARPLRMADFGFSRHRSINNSRNDLFRE